MDINKFNHYDFFMLCNHYPIDLKAVDTMLKSKVDFSKVSLEESHDFLLELMENIIDGRITALCEGNENADDEFLYEVLKRIFEKGYKFPNDNNETLQECLSELYYSNRDLYLPEITKLFLDYGADIDYIVNKDEYSDDNVFTLAQIGLNIGHPDNSIFDSSIWSTTYEIICSARNNQPYELILPLERCNGLTIKEIYVGKGLTAYSKSDNWCSDKSQYRIIFTNGQQLVVNDIIYTFMSPYDETWKYGNVIELGEDHYSGETIKSIRSFFRPNSRGRYHLGNIWLYLNNGYILKFFDVEIEGKEAYDLSLICEMGE